MTEGMSSLHSFRELEALVAACEAAYAGPNMAEFDDDEDISHPPSGITFGMIRRARAELDEAAAS
jgi:hypothetical protein